MYITGVKIAMVEALVSGFNTINPIYKPNLTGQFNYPSDTSIDLTPNSVTIEYPMEEIQWPAIFVQFRPSKTQWMGLNPDAYILNSGTGNYTQSREIYFEGVIDFQILAMHSEERDKLWDSVYNLILMNPGNPASAAFNSSISSNDLIGITLLESTVQSLGDTVSPGTPFSPEELTYESTLRINCVGQSFESKYNFGINYLGAIAVSGVLMTGQYSIPTTSSGVVQPIITIS